MLKLRGKVNNHNIFKIIGYTWAVLSTTGTCLTHLWPQMGSGKVVDPVKLSILAGTVWKRKWRAWRSLSSCQIVKPAFTALSRLWSPQLPTLTGWTPYSSACSFWRSPIFKLPHIPFWNTLLWIDKAVSIFKTLYLEFVLFLKYTGIHIKSIVFYVRHFKHIISLQMLMKC